MNFTGFMDLFDTAEATPAPDAAAAETAQAGTLSGGASLLEYLMIAMALYLIVSAIRGKGKMFENNYPKCGREKFVKWMRILCAIAAPLIALNPVLLITGVYEEGNTWSSITWAVGLVAVIGLVAFTVIMTDRKAAAEAQAKEEASRRVNHTRAAFEFDDEEETPSQENEDRTTENQEDN